MIARNIRTVNKARKNLQLPPCAAIFICTHSGYMI